MAWDTERTKALLLAAAVEEFAAHGFGGARVDRIAKSAGVNKERIYQYFGGKAKLFDAVLLSELDRIAEAVPIKAETPDGLADYAADVFDYHLRRPHLARLLHWEGLERPAKPELAQTERARRYQNKVAAVAAALPAADTVPRAADLVLTIITLATSWHALGQVHLMVEGTAPDPEQRRAAIREAVRRMVTPVSGG